MTLRLFPVAVLAATLVGCATADPTPALKMGDMHFPTRLVDNLDDATLSTFRGDLIQEGNCLYLTNVTNRMSDKRFVVTWPSNARIEREIVRGGSKLEVVSMGAEFNDNTRSVAEIPGRVEVLGRIVNQPFDPAAARLKSSVQRDCKGSGIAQVRTWKYVGKSRTPSMK